MTSADVYDVRPCLRQHIQTLRMMHDEWCKGFATSEEDALKMMWYANSQGKNYCDDLQLLRTFPNEPDYSLVTLTLPLALGGFGGAVPVARNANADQLTGVHESIERPATTLYPVAAVRAKVGSWSGGSSASHVFLQIGNKRAPYLWGWGHAATITDNNRYLFHKYTPGGNDLDDGAYDTLRGNVHIDDINKWNDRVVRQNYDSVPANSNMSLRDSIFAPKESVYSGARQEDTYGLVHSVFPATVVPKVVQKAVKLGLRTAGPISTIVNKGTTNNFENYNPPVPRSPEFPLQSGDTIDFCTGFCGEKYLECTKYARFTRNKHGIWEFPKRLLAPISKELVMKVYAPGQIFTVLQQGAAHNPLEDDLRSVLNQYGCIPVHSLWTHHGLAGTDSALDRVALAQDATQAAPQLIYVHDLKLNEDGKLPLSMEGVNASAAVKYGLQLHLLRLICQYTLDEDITEFVFTHQLDDNIAAEWQDDTQMTVNAGALVHKTTGSALAPPLEKEVRIRRALQTALRRLRAVFTDSDKLTAEYDNYCTAKGAGANPPIGPAALIPPIAPAFAPGAPAANFPNDGNVPYWFTAHVMNSPANAPQERTQFFRRTFIPGVGYAPTAVPAAGPPRKAAKAALVATAAKADQSILAIVAQLSRFVEDDGYRGVQEPEPTYGMAAANFTAIQGQLAAAAGAGPFPGLNDAIRQFAKETAISVNVAHLGGSLGTSASAFLDVVRANFDNATQALGAEYLRLQAGGPGGAAFPFAGPPPPVGQLLDDGDINILLAVPGVPGATDYDSRALGLNYSALKVTKKLIDSLRQKLIGGGELLQNSKASARLLDLTKNVRTGDWGYNKRVKEAKYNFDSECPNLFAALDAAALLKRARACVNAAASHRPTDDPNTPNDNELDADEHYGIDTLVDAFGFAREDFFSVNTNTGYWETAIMQKPKSGLPSTCIGAMTEAAFGRAFPLMPKDHSIRDDLRRVRALNVLWGDLSAYSFGNNEAPGAWMPLSEAHRVSLLKTVGLFDLDYNVPANPWCAHNGVGLSRVFNQSYHSVYPLGNYRDPHFKEWALHACPYRKPKYDPNGPCVYPFSEYGGHPTQGDFMPHCVHRPLGPYAKRHSQLVYNRFGHTGPVRVGHQFHDGGLLQDYYSFEYRSHANLTPQQRQIKDWKEVHPTNFMAYARVHSIIALASRAPGTMDMDPPRVTRNLFRLFVDAHEHMGASFEDDNLPVVMGFVENHVVKKDDRPIVLYAGSLECLNTKLERFCASQSNRGERVCFNYKQAYLNDSTLLYMRLLRASRRRALRAKNFEQIQAARPGRYERDEFNDDLHDLKDAYIEFLQSSLLGMLIESGADLTQVPINLLEPRELKVSIDAEDKDVVANDYLTPHTREIIKNMDFSGDSLTRTQIALLSLLPPNHRVLGTLRLQQDTKIMDLEHVRKQLEKDTIEKKKKAWQKYLEGLVDSSFAYQYMQGKKMDFGFDDSVLRLDPLAAGQMVPKRMAATGAQATTSLSANQRANTLRKDMGINSIVGMEQERTERYLQAVRQRVEREYQRDGGRRSRWTILHNLHMVPKGYQRMLEPEYMNS